MRRLILLIILLVTPLAKANLLVEPYAGMQPGGELSMKSFKDAANGSFTSFMYGGRVGLDFTRFFLGGEYLASKAVSVKFPGPNPWSKNDANVTMTNGDLGAFIGYEFMEPAVRIYATYFASSDAHLTSPGATSNADIQLQGYGYKFEIDSRVTKFLSLGVSYYHHVYMKWVDNSTRVSTPATPVNSQHSLLITLAIPLEL